MPHPSTSPHINPIENGGSSRHYTGESTNEAEIEAATLKNGLQYHKIGLMS
jgi:hypothetical protein